MDALKQLKACSFDKWYCKFSNITFKSEIIQLPDVFVKYLDEDRFVLPVSGDSEDRSSQYSSEDESWESNSFVNEPSFPDLKAKVNSSIIRLGGSVFPKLNWSSARDASWISHNGLPRCESFNEICLLLKSSDFVAHDLNLISNSNGDIKPTLVLRQWADVSPSMEFRCFVNRRRLIAISQRDVTNCYPHVISQKDNLHESLENFFLENIANHFPMSAFVFDVHVYDSSKIKLIDFNPYDQKSTDSLLFSWDEIGDLITSRDTEANSITTQQKGMFRIMETTGLLQPSSLLSSRLPKDFIDLSNGTDIDKMVDLLNINDLVSRPDDFN